MDHVQQQAARVATIQSLAASFPRELSTSELDGALRAQGLYLDDDLEDVTSYLSEVGLLVVSQRDDDGIPLRFRASAAALDLVAGIGDDIPGVTILAPRPDHTGMAKRGRLLQVLRVGYPRPSSAQTVQMALARFGIYDHAAASTERELVYLADKGLVEATTDIPALYRLTAVGVQVLEGHMAVSGVQIVRR